jgi:hypothetical protein
MIKQGVMRLRRTSPIALAITYSIMASISTATVAWIDNGIHQQVLIINGREVLIRGLLDNYSTVLDFILLNPAVIFFMQSAYLSTLLTQKRMRKDSRVSPYHSIGLSILALFCGVVFMSLYFKGFLHGNFFTVMIAPDNTGHVRMTLTGWVTFLWTTIFIMFILLRFGEQYQYTRFIITLRKSDIKYVPFHCDYVCGVRYLINPTLKYTYGMICLLIIFIIFIIQDNIIYNINESIRYVGFYIYVIIAIPFFCLPTYHLHKIMKSKYRDYSNKMDLMVRYLQSEQSVQSDVDNDKLREYLGKLDILEKYQRVLLSLPTWPLPVKTFAIPISSIIGALVPIVKQLLHIDKLVP